MSVKLATTMILGLVFQLAQVLPAASSATVACQPQGESCACCAGASFCPCAENDDPDRELPPLPFDAGGTQKTPPMKPAETIVSAVVNHEPGHPAAAPAPPPAGPVRGYAGVSLSVAFCSFVI